MSTMKRYPCGGMRRRQFLAAGATAGAAAMLTANRLSAASTEVATSPVSKAALGVPGPYPGKVVEARNPKMIQNDVKDQEAIGTTLGRALMGLTGAEDATEAWRTFFEPGDVVGIKMNPVGRPLANSSSELMLEVIEGLKSAGVKTQDMVVFERYLSEFVDAGMHKDVPDGIDWTGLTKENDPSQLNIAGYDPDEFISMELVHPADDPKDDRTRRSHLGLLVTKRVNKMVLLPVLKDHGSGGVTGALKNMSHGLVNNVRRSHGNAHTNVCNQFIPEVVMHPIIRQKAVLQIMDGIKGVFQGGPFARNPEWTWENNALLVGTDPVAMDRILWDYIDAKRAEKGLKPVGSVGKLAFDAEREGFDIRQPQHITLAGYLGLGVFNKPGEGGTEIDHQIINIEAS